jgi:hypothetical protein
VPNAISGSSTRENGYRRHKSGVSGCVGLELPAIGYMTEHPKSLAMICCVIMHLFPGISGVIVGALIPVGLLVILYLKKANVNYYLDPNGVSGAFEPFLAKYLKLAETMIGLATGSIVLLVGSSALNGHGGHLPWFYASPLYLLAYSVFYGIGFSAWLIFHYEMYQHDHKHSRLQYALSETLGFSSLCCFLCGYVWLIARVVL